MSGLFQAEMNAIKLEDKLNRIDITILLNSCANTLIKTNALSTVKTDIY